MPIRAAQSCEACGGSGAAPGTEPVTCPECDGAGRVQQVSQSVFGQFVRTGACPRCDGRGRVVETPCATCEGIGRTLVDRELDIDIPAGIDDRQRIRVRGQGHAGSLGGPAGDLFVEVRVRPEPGIERDGHDLHTAIELTMTRGCARHHRPGSGPGERDRGRHRSRHPAGARPTFRFQGMPSIDDRRSGHFHVHVRVRVPRHLDDAQRALVEQLGDALGEDAYRDDEDDGGFFGRIKNAFR